MQLELEEQEAALVYRVLRNRHRELRQEVRHTHDAEARDYLLHKERILNRVLAKFPELDERAHMTAYERKLKATPV